MQWEFFHVRLELDSLATCLDFHCNFRTSLQHVLQKYFDQLANPKTNLDLQDFTLNSVMLVQWLFHIHHSECGTTIAEYRQFVKPNEASDVGLAKPQEPQTSDIHREEIPTVPDAVSGEIKPIDGMAVYDGSGIKIGNARQIGIDGTKSLVLSIDKDDGTNMAVPWSQVKKVGEIILLKGADDVIKSDDGCPECGKSNKPGSKFCEHCGNKI